MENPSQQSQTNQFTSKMSKLKFVVEKISVGGIQK